MKKIHVIYGANFFPSIKKSQELFKYFLIIDRYWLYNFMWKKNNSELRDFIKKCYVNFNLFIPMFHKKFFLFD